MRDGRALDLTRPPLVDDLASWTDLADYAACQALADNARAAEIAIIRSESVRDPAGRANLALLTCFAFAAQEPAARQTWRLSFGRAGIRAVAEFPDSVLNSRPAPSTPIRALRTSSGTAEARG